MIKLILKFDTNWGLERRDRKWGKNNYVGIWTEKEGGDFLGGADVVDEGELAVTWPVEQLTEFAVLKIATTGMENFQYISLHSHYPNKDNELNHRQYEREEIKEWNIVRTREEVYDTKS